jgi:hypothetical protein
VATCAATEQEPPLDRRRIALIVGALLLGMLLAALGQTIVAPEPTPCGTSAWWTSAARYGLCNLFHDGVHTWGTAAAGDRA